MYRALCVLLCVSSFALAQTSNQAQSNGSAASSAVQVVDVINGSTLTTYNVDPTTFEATEVGAITITQSANPELVTSPNGRFLYYLAFNDSNSGNSIYVYDTNASGLPRNTPVQTVNAPQLYWEAIAHPSGRFLYTLAVGHGSGGTTPYAIVGHQIDENDGRLSQPVKEATYQLDSGTSFCNPWIMGFNASGSIMYDAILCSYPHGSGGATYNERSVDLKTGALGPDQQIFTWNEYAGNGNNNVQFVKNLMFDFGMTEFPPTTWVDIFQAQPSVTTPLVNCTGSMWAVCGNSSGIAHPSGEYVFLGDDNSGPITYIGRINRSTREIAQTDSIPYWVGEFSPDGTVIYADNTTDVVIFGFCIESGQAVQGGTISGMASYPTPGTYLATERY